MKPLSLIGSTLALVIAGSYDRDGQSQNAKLFVADAAAGQSRKEVGKYDAPAWSPHGTRLAAFSDRGLAVLDATTRQEIERVALPKGDAPLQDIVWSPGENGGAGDPQNNYQLAAIEQSLGPVKNTRAAAFASVSIPKSISRSPVPSGRRATRNAVQLTSANKP